jgi:glycosyltransferase involved in cell wall biosynthesis
MPDVYFASDVVALTSDNEGTPVSLIEALAAGTPVASTDVGGVASVVRHQQTGLLAPAHDERALADAIARQLGDPGLACRMAAQGRRAVLGAFTLERLVEELDGLYASLLKGG